MSNLTRVFILIAVMTALAVGSAATTAEALTLDTLRVNLLLNPGAESGKGWSSDAPYAWFPSIGNGTVYSTSDKFYSVEPKFGVNYFGHEKGTGDAATVGIFHPTFDEYADAIDNGGVDITIGGWFLSQDGEDDGGLALSWDGVDLTSRSSNWSSDWTTAKWDAITTSNPDKVWSPEAWTWEKETVSVPSGRHFALFYMLADRDDGSNNNVCFDGLVAALSNLTFDMDFGDLYANKNSTAETFNLSDSRSKILTLESTSKLNWKITLPAGIAEREIEVSTGTSTAYRPGESITGTVDGTKDITIRINPPAGSSLNYSKQMTIRTYTPVTNDNVSPITDGSDYRIGTYYANLKADVYGLPTVSYVGPGRGSNDKVNVALNENGTFVVSSGDPLHPNATIAGYEWQLARGTTPPSPTSWDPTSANQKTFYGEFTEDGEYTVYARMRDSNGVGSDHLAIPVRVWERPEVSNAPPGDAIAAEIVSWYDGSGTDDYYVGVSGEPVTLMADGSTASSDERIVKYLWYDGNDVLLGQQYGGPFATSTDPVLDSSPRFGTSALTFDGEDDYVQLAQPLPIFSSSFTVSMWVKVPSSLTWGILLGDYGLDGVNVNFEINNGGQLWLYWDPDHLVGTRDLRDNTWHFIAFVRDKDANKVYGYVDGEKDFEHSGSIGDKTATVPHRIGRDARTGEFPFEGSMDEVAIFDRALVQEEIENLMDAALEGNEDGLLEYWSFDHMVTHTWYTSNLLTEIIYCKAVTNYGIQSHDQSDKGEPFDLTVYRALEADPGGPYTGRPNQPVELEGSINTTSYAVADLQYQWYVKDGDTYVDTVDTDSDGRGEYVWTADGDYTVEFEATVTTVEGLILTDGGSTTVHVESGVPTAMPGGPYRGGIAGGNFSPIQFQGNAPDFVEAEDIGNIQEWEWSFSGRLMGNVLRFDGVNDYVELTEPLSIFSSSFTVSMWVKVPSDASGRVGVLLGDYGLGGANINFEIHSSGQLRFYWNGDPNVYGARDLRDDTWHFIAFVRDKEGSTVYGYVDGEVDLEYSGSIDDKTATVAHRIGRDSRTGDPVFEGSIDEVAIFNRALTQAEIQTNMDQVLAGNEDGLVGYWSFDEGSGTTTADGSPSNNQGTLHSATWVNLAEATGWNPTHAFPQAGEYNVDLRVKSEFGKWSVAQTTTVEVIDGKITGYVRAADLRTPVQGVRLTLTSPHVDGDALASVAGSDSTLRATGTGGIWTETDENGYYAFDHLPLGSYSILANKVEKKYGEPDFLHEFEANVLTTELTLDTPARNAFNFVDLSVFPISGGVVYSLKKDENGVLKDVFVENVVIEAQPVGSTSDIESLPSTKSEPTNYSLPLFAGEYLFKAERGGHDIRLIGTESATGETIGEPPPGYDSDSGLLTIETARTDIDFIDYTTRDITVYLEDSGGYPVDIYQDELLFSVEDTLKAEDISDTLNAGSVPDSLRGEFDANGTVLSQNTEVTVREAGTWWLIQDTEYNKLYSVRKRGDVLDTFEARKIVARVTGTNGFAEGEVSAGDTTLFEATVPPGQYTVSIPNVSTAILKGNSSQKEASVDVTTSNASVTMVIPVPIELEIGPQPTLLPDDLPDEFFAAIGLTREDNPEGFMAHSPGQEQTHMYTIKARANGNLVSNFTLKVTDNISQLSDAPAPQRTYPDPNDARYGEAFDEQGEYIAQYTVIGGTPNMTVVDTDDPSTYLEYDIDPDTTNVTLVKVPRVKPKEVTFLASKDGYEPSRIYTRSVTVLGDVSAGSAPEIVAVPSVNYLVLHDPPGDESYSYIDDEVTIKGIIMGMKIKTEAGAEIPVYPSPWSEERRIDDVDFEEIINGSHDLGDQGLLDRRQTVPAVGAFAIAAAFESIKGGIIVATGAVPGAAVAAHLVNVGLMTAFLTEEASDVIPGLQGVGIIQHEINPSRHLETPSGDETPDLMGPGKGDVYYGEGWTLGLQTKHRLGIKPNPHASADGPAYDPNYDPSNPSDAKWIPDTAQLATYAILDRDNQYTYTTRDIENIIGNLETTATSIDTTVEDPAEKENRKEEKQQLEGAKDTWENLLDDNPAYVWHRDHVLSDDPNARSRETLEAFLQEKFSGQEGELLVFSAGPAFEYSRHLYEGQVTSFSTSVSVSTSADFEGSSKQKFGTFAGLGAGVTAEFVAVGTGAHLLVDTSQEFGAGLESGSEAEQTVGFVLQDSDIGDNISTYVYEGPWGTPIFFTDPGSITSDPWQAGTNKAVDVKLELLSVENYGPFDYHDGAHYPFRISSIGKRKLEGSGINFLFYDLPIGNSRSATVTFNGSDEAPYTMELFKGFSQSDLFAGAVPEDSISVPSSRIMVSIYPPERDWENSHEQEYPVLVQAEEADDYQIAVNKLLRPRFADLRAPRATITAPYDGQRISPEVFTGEKTFRIEVFSDDPDLARIQVQIRNKQTDGVWSSWQIRDGMLWEEGGTNANVTVETVDSGLGTDRRVFTFDWAGTDIKTLGVGEYALCAVAQDRATRRKTDGTQEPKPNVDPDPPVVRVVVDGDPPTVLTSIPDYQAKESERIYRGELSVLFTDDMRADDFTDRTFVVTDLLHDDPNSPPEIAGFVSYSPSLRKATFVPKIPFKPNGYYQAEMRKPDPSTDQEGVYDLAGNPLDNTFMWTFRTKDAPFEETWSIVLSVTDGTDLDGNNIAGVAYGALDEEDEKDARAVPGMANQMRQTFLDRDKVRFDRDLRPADGRLSHHWFFVVENASEDSTVTLRWRPSIKLTRTTRHYQVIQLVEFDNTGGIANVISIDPTLAPTDPATGLPQEIVAYTYENTSTRVDGSGSTLSFDVNSRHFRLDVQKALFVAGTLEAGTSGWKFLSVPITPQRAEPFVNLGDDIDPFKLYQYETEFGGYKIYPLDIGEVALQTGHAYFTRLQEDVEADVGGTLNQEDISIGLGAAGWHAIGNPFIAPVDVAELKINDQVFDDAFAAGLVEGTLYRWDVVPADDMFQATVDTSDGYAPVSSIDGQLDLWEGYWLKTNQDGLTLTIPVPDPLPIYPPSTESLLPQMKSVAWNAGQDDGIQGHPSPGQFDLQLALHSEFASDLTTALGTREDAQIGWDHFDQSEPPTLSGTVAAFFDHPDWEERAGSYDREYQPTLEVGEERIWTFVVYTDKQDAEMTLSWEESITQVPDDIMLHFRRVDQSPTQWSDMREVGSIPLSSRSTITEVPFEVRAQRFELSSPSQVEVIPGEAQVVLRWTASENLFIENYVVERVREGTEETRRFELSPLDAEFVDTDVEEEATYTYRLLVYFRSGAHWESDPFTVTVLPTIAETVLLQSYPNPFNPEVWIPYELAEEASVEMLIYNAAGQLIRRLELGVQPRGRYVGKPRSAYWDGRDEYGDPASSGVYFYVLRAGSFTAMRKMTVLK